MAGSPLAQAVADSIRREIGTGSIESGKPLPAERELAERFQVSRASVRQAVAILARQGWVRAQPHCRPVATIPSEIASGPVGTKKDHVSVWLWPYVDDFAASSIFRGIQRAMVGAPLRLMVASAANGTWEQVLQSEDAFLREIAEDESCAGAVVWLLGGNQATPALEKARSHGLPLVFLDRKPPSDFEADFVGTENVGAARRAVSHLLELGHRRIACVRNSDSASSVDERVEGYRLALEDGGVAVDESLVFQVEPEIGESEASAIDRLVRAIMCEANPPTAIFAINDATALQIVDALERSGLRVPDSVSVVGFDGLLRWIPGGGRLTSAHQEFVRIGELAAEMLLERIATGEPKTYRHVLLDAPLKVRGTTAPVQSDDDPGQTANSPLELAS